MAGTKVYVRESTRKRRHGSPSKLHVFEPKHEGVSSSLLPVGPLTGWRNLVCQNSSYMIFAGRSLEIESSRLFSRNGRFYEDLREKRIKWTGAREAI